MNLSGLGLLSFLSFIAKSFEDKIIIHDELDLPPGRIRISHGGGTAGHKGVLSIAEYCNLEKFIRLRVGIGKPIQKDEITEYVLLKPPAVSYTHLDVYKRQRIAHLYADKIKRNEVKFREYQ